MEKPFYLFHGDRRHLEAPETMLGKDVDHSAGSRIEQPQIVPEQRFMEGGPKAGKIERCPCPNETNEE